MRILYTSLILITLSIISCTPVLAADIAFTISSDKSEYTKKDPINITLKLKNNSKSPVYINRRFYINSDEAGEYEREVYFSVTSPGGEKLLCKHTSDTGLPRTDMFVLLKSGEEVSADSQKDIKHLFDFSQPGVYGIAGTYKNSCGRELGLDTFKERVESKPIKIKILE